MEYGTGAIMAVPGHDERDFEFAKKFGLPIVRVVARGASPSSRAERGTSPADPDRSRQPTPTTSSGVLVNSGQFDGLPVPEAKRAITAWLEPRGRRQGRRPVPAPRLVHLPPALLGPADPDHLLRRARRGAGAGEGPAGRAAADRGLPPDDSGISPLARHEEWYYVPCPVCGKRSRRETDVSDTFLDSAWYHLRYPSTEFDDRPFDPARTKKWLPVHTYIGGNEHAVLHLLYSRFITMVLHDLGHLHFDEPYRKFRAHGLIVKDGAKMSKSRGNVVVPDEYIARWGADTFRMYLMFLGPFQEGGDFRDEGISGPRRFLDKVWGLVRRRVPGRAAGDEIRHEVLVKCHQTVKRVTEGLEELRYNTSHRGADGAGEHACGRRTARSGAWWRSWSSCWRRSRRTLRRRAGSGWGTTASVFDARWPAWDEGLMVEDQVEVVVQVSGKTRSKVSVPRDADAGCGGGGGAAGCGGAAVYGGEGGSEGGVRAEPVAEPGSRVAFPPMLATWRRRLSFPAATAVSLGLAACGTDPGACTANIQSAVTVRALAAGTGENVTDGARGTVSEGTYADSLRPAELDAAQRVLLLSGADERPGTYDLFVERDGYQAVSLGGLVATAGECHVNTVSVNVTMVPIP